MSALSFLLALGALASATAWAVAAASWAARPLVGRLGPVLRAEASAWLALLPALSGLALAAAVAAPSAAVAVGLAEDHCLGHFDHVHLCAWHGAHLPPWLAAVGAAAWAYTGARLAVAVARLARAERIGAALAALGEARDGVVVVPATAAVCHAVGWARPRVVVSRSVLDRLGADEIAAVIAHERAHIHRADPRWAALLEVAACASPLVAPWARSWREAAEEAADAAAAGATDGPTVASALVEVARLRLSPVAGMALGGDDLERRVARLLAGTTSPRPTVAGRVAVAMGLLAAVAVAATHEPVHHAVEEAWEHALGSHEPVAPIYYGW